MTLTKKQRNEPFEDGEVRVCIVVHRLPGGDAPEVAITRLRRTVATVGAWHATCATVAKRVAGVDHSDVWARLLKLKPGESFIAGNGTRDYRYGRES